VAVVEETEDICVIHSLVREVALMGLWTPHAYYFLFCFQTFCLLGYNAVFSGEKSTGVSEEHVASNQS
jgi:hypothetical protein